MTDQIDPNDIEVTGGSPDVRSWPATVTITRVTLSPQEVSFDAIGLIRWPHVTPPGWDGGIQSTLWIVVKGPDGRWRSTGSIEFYAGRSGTGSPLSSALKDWWYYAPDIGQPQPGDVVGLFLAAGDQRRKDVRSVDERSNIVTFTVPPNDSGSFTFADAPAPQPDPVPQPEPTPDVPGGFFASQEWQRLVQTVDDIAAEQGQMLQVVQENEAKADAFRKKVDAAVRKFGAQLLAQKGKP
jgi:hypothetical protein